MIIQWHKELNDISHILQYLHTYPKALSDLNIKDLITSKEVQTQYESWLRLYPKYTGIEQEFFKPYWLPIQRIGFDYFIDMSNSNYPVIEVFYNYFDEPYYWEKKILLPSITKLMLAEENKIDLEQYRVKKIIEKFRKYTE